MFAMRQLGQAKRFRRFPGEPAETRPAPIAMEKYFSSFGANSIDFQRVSEGPRVAATPQ
jgi:hypothetical protein